MKNPSKNEILKTLGFTEEFLSELNDFDNRVTRVNISGMDEAPDSIIYETIQVEEEYYATYVDVQVSQ